MTSIKEEISSIQKMICNFKPEAKEKLDEILRRDDLSIEDKIQCKILKIKRDLFSLSTENVLALAEECIAESKKCDSPQLILDSLISKAVVISKTGKRTEAKEFDEFVELVEQIERLYKELEKHNPSSNINQKACFLYIKGKYYQWKKNYDLSLQYFLECLELREKVGCISDTIYCLEDIGNTYSMIGDGAMSMEYFAYGVSLAGDNLGFMLNISNPADSVGSILWRQWDLTGAINDFERSLELRKKIGHKLMISMLLFDLVTINIDNNSIDKAKEYVSQLKQIHEENKSQLISQLYRVADASVFKTSSRVHNISKAQVLLKEVLQEEYLNIVLTVSAMLNLADLLFTELKLSQEKEILEELKELLNNLLLIAKEKHCYWLLAEVYYHHSKLALVELNIKEAQRLLNLSQELADRKGLGGLAMKISADHDKILNNLSKWEELIESNASYKERIELAELEEMVVGMIRKKAIEVPEVEQEQPILLIIVSSEGLTVFSEKFISDTLIDEMLIGGFLNAINSFIQTTLSATGSIERIKHQEYTLLLNAQDPLLFCYVIKGQSYIAIKKLDNLTNKLKVNESLWTALTEKIRKGKAIDESEKKDVLEIVKKELVP